MSDQVRVLSRRTGRPMPEAGVSLGALVLVALLVAAAFAAGHLIDRPGRAPASVRPTAAGPAAVAAPAPSEKDTETGAVSALLADTQTLSDPRVLLDPTRRAQALAQIATPRYAATFAGSGAQALDRIRQTTPLGRGLASGARTVYLAVPVAYHVLAYSAHSITVSGYGVSVVANDTGLSPRASWATTTTTALWSDGRWKVDSARSTAGPTPAPTARASAAAAFLNELATAKEIRDAP